jgi:DNA mismatch repair protein MutL
MRGRRFPITMMGAMTQHAQPPRIHRLPTVLANQIAAGEVVERPASIVKELLENSLDAGASAINLEVERGGVGLIRVRDDGSGIHREDLGLALARHATSKVHTLEDLERVSSLGFRGEALPSIASVSRMVLSSRAEAEDRGWQVVAEGGPPTGEAAPVPHPPGTTVEVRDLFYNTPARRKFLRSERTELGHLHEVIKRIALSRFDTGLRLRHDARSVLSLSPARDEAQRTRRLAAVCGAAFVEKSLALEYSAMDMRLWGWVGDPGYSRSQADLQYFYLNGRLVRDKLVQHAVRQAYQDLIYQGRHPAYVLYLELDPSVADVNVHPTKQEVRFREARLVHDFIYRCVARALGTGAGGDAGQVTAGGWATGRAPAAHGPGRVGEAIRDYASLSDGGHAADTAPGDAPALGRPLAVLEGGLLLARNAAGLVLVDLQAARERVTQRRLFAALEEGGVRSQPLLVPLSLKVGQRRAALAEEHRELILSLGLELTRLGPTSVAVHRIPAMLRGSDPARLATSLLEALEDGMRDAPSGNLGDALLERLAAQAGGNAAEDSPEHLDGLLREVERLQADPIRPLWVQMTPNDLAAYFRRGSTGGDRAPGGEGRG